MPSSVAVSTTVTRSFIISPRRTSRSYRGYKTISHVESVEIYVARSNAGRIVLAACRLPDTVKLAIITFKALQGNQLILRTCSIVVWPSDIRVHQPPILSSFYRFVQRWLYVLSVMLHLPYGTTMLEKRHQLTV